MRDGKALNLRHRTTELLTSFVVVVQENFLTNIYNEPKMLPRNNKQKERFPLVK